MPTAFSSCWQAEMPTLQRVDLTVRTPMRQAALHKDNKVPVEELRIDRNNGRARSMAAGAATAIGFDRQLRCARPLAARSAADLRQLRHRTLEHAGARGSQAGGRRPPRRSGDVQSALRPRRRRPRQDAPAAGGDVCRQRQRTAQGAVPDRRKVHVRLRTGAEEPDGARLQGHAARHRRAGDRRPAVPAG